MTVERLNVRRAPLIFDSLRTFDAYLSGMESEYDAQTDGEVTQAGGYDRMIRTRACLQLLRDLRAVLAESFEGEDAEREQVAAEDSIEQRYREAYGPEPLAPWQAEGR